MLPDMIEMGELSPDAAEIIPDARKNGLDLRRRFFRERCGQVSAADPLLAQHRSDETGDPAEQIGGLDRIEIAGGAQQSDPQGPDPGLAERLGRVANSGVCASGERMHQKLKTIR